MRRESPGAKRRYLAELAKPKAQRDAELEARIKGYRNPTHAEEQERRPAGNFGGRPCEKGWVGTLGQCRRRTATHRSQDTRIRYEAAQPGRYKAGLAMTDKLGDDDPRSVAKQARKIIKEKADFDGITEAYKTKGDGKNLNPESRLLLRMYRGHKKYLAQTLAKAKTPPVDNGVIAYVERQANKYFADDDGIKQFAKRVTTSNSDLFRESSALGIVKKNLQQRY